MQTKATQGGMSWQGEPVCTRNPGRPFTTTSLNCVSAHQCGCTCSHDHILSVHRITHLESLLRTSLLHVCNVRVFLCVCSVCCAYLQCPCHCRTQDRFHRPCCLSPPHCLWADHPWPHRVPFPADAPLQTFTGGYESRADKQTRYVAQGLDVTQYPHYVCKPRLRVPAKLTLTCSDHICYSVPDFGPQVAHCVGSVQKPGRGVHDL